MKTIKSFTLMITIILITGLNYSCSSEEEEPNDPFQNVGTLFANGKEFYFMRRYAYLQIDGRGTYISLTETDLSAHVFIHMDEYTTGEISDKAIFISMLDIIGTVNFVSGSVRLTKQKDLHIIEFKNAYFKTEKDYYGRFEEITVNGRVELKDF